MSAFTSRTTPLMVIVISSAAFGFILACAMLQSNNNANASAQHDRADDGRRPLDHSG